MSESLVTLDTRRRRVRFRCWHRGMREVDLLMGRFADAAVADMTPQELDELELLMEAQDRDIFAWLTGEAAVPPMLDTAIYRRLRAFHTHDRPLHA